MSGMNDNMWNQGAKNPTSDDIGGTISWDWARTLFFHFMAGLIFYYIQISAQEQGLTDIGFAIAKGMAWLTIRYAFSMLESPKYNFAYANPIISMAVAMSAYRLPVFMLLFQWLVDAASSVLATLLVWGFAAPGSTLGTPITGIGRTEYQAFGAEIIGGWILCSIILWINLKIWSSYQRDHSGGNAIGPLESFIMEPFGTMAAQISITLAIVFVSGGILNPFCYLWPAWISGNISGLGAMAYIAGPIIGSAVAGLLNWGYTNWYSTDKQLTQSDVGKKANGNKFMHNIDY